MDEQQRLDDETKARRYDRIAKAQEKVEDLQDQLAYALRQVRDLKEKLKNARWDLGAAMSPVRKGVRG